jgi:hypothetical protein
VPQQWWRLCQNVVYGMYIKWQYKWFGKKFLFFFFNSPSELTFWITLAHICNDMTQWCNKSNLHLYLGGDHFKTQP